MNETNNQLIDVSFGCQRCCQPLRMHSTLNTINEQIISELSSVMNTNHRNDDKVLQTKEVNQNVIYKVVEPIRSSKESSNGNGFIVIEESTTSLTPSMSSITLCNSGDHKNESTLSANSHKFSNQTKMFRELFDILSDQSDVDHPLCEECADFVIDQMDHQLRVLEDECRDYSDYLQSIQSQESVNQLDTELEINELKQKLVNLEITEKQLLEELKEVNCEQLKLNEELDKHSNELQRLYSEEDKYWHEYNNVRNNVFICDDEQQSIDNQLRYAQTLFDKLKRTNVFNATFHIWFVFYLLNHFSFKLFFS
jgi:beclin 1